MSLRDAGQSLWMSIPSSYHDVQAHHVVVAYAAWNLWSSSHLAERLSDKVLSLLSSFSERLVGLVQLGLVPDFLIRFGIRIQLRDRLALLRSTETTAEQDDKMQIVRQLHTMPIAVMTKEANDQHYEVPARFYDLCLGPCKKYSSGLWPTSRTTFEESEILMLDLYCERAELEDGMSIVDLGCGWGSLTLHLCAKYPNAKITSISNSHTQKDYILNTAKARGLNHQNIKVITCNVADDEGALQVVRDNDRVMTVEMFEHMKNYDDLLQKVHGFLKPGGKLFVHIFTHKDYTYHFEDGWMSRNFFSGGTMPSDDLLLYFAKSFAIEQHWRVNGTNYEKTSNGWLAYLDQNWRNGSLKPVLTEAYGVGSEREWYVNWRLFFMACAELWGFRGGNEWIVSHYLFVSR